MNKWLIILPSVFLAGMTGYIFIFFPDFIPGTIKSTFESSFFWVMAVVVSIMFIGPVFWFLLMWLPIANRAKLMNTIYGRGHGILRLKGKGRLIDKWVINFNKPWIRIPYKGMFVLQDWGIYVEDGVQTITFNEMDALEASQELGQKLDERRDNISKEIKEFIKNGERVFANPVSYDKALEERKESHDPLQMENLWARMEASAETNAITAFDDFFKKYGIIFLAGAGILIGVGVFLVDTLMNQVQPQVFSIFNDLPKMREDVDKLKAGIDFLVQKAGG